MRRGAVKLMHRVLGLRKHHKLSQYVIDLFIDVGGLWGVSPILLSNPKAALPCL